MKIISDNFSAEMTNTYIKVDKFREEEKRILSQMLSHWTVQATRSQSTFSSTGPASRSDGTKKQRSVRLYMEDYDPSNWSDDHFDEDLLFP